MSDYILPFPYQHRDLSPGLLDERRRREEYQALQLLFRDPNLATKLEEVKKNFAVKAHGKNAASGLGALFLFNREAAKSEATSKVTLANGDQRFFFHREFVKSRSTGVEKMRIDLGQSDILVANRKRIRITTEMDRDKLRSLYARFKAQKILHTANKIQKELAKNRNERDPKKMPRLFEKFIKNLEIETFGLRALAQLVGEDGLFVMGDIAGVFPSFNTLQDLQQNQRRRFAGSSWGTYDVSPPLQKFMRRHRLIPPSAHITKIKSDREILGKLENAVAPNLEFVFDHNDQF